MRLGATNKRIRSQAQMIHILRRQFGGALLCCLSPPPVAQRKEGNARGSREGINLIVSVNRDGFMESLQG